VGSLRSFLSTKILNVDHFFTAIFSCTSPVLISGHFVSSKVAKLVIHCSFNLLTAAKISATAGCCA
jgi:hypothetical protein